MKAAVMEVVQENFRPEFINRIDDICVFHPLGQAQIRAIVDIQLAQLEAAARPQPRARARRLGARSLSEAGYDPVYGARPLKRAIQQQVENPLGHGDSCRSSYPARGSLFARRPTATGSSSR
jgi:ATP-dependent Clp protease ATP-binding subunit ClpB